MWALFAASRGIHWADAMQQLANQSSIHLDAGEFKEVIGGYGGGGAGEGRRGVRRSSMWIILPDDFFFFSFAVVIHPRIILVLFVVCVTIRITLEVLYDTQTRKGD